MPATEYAFDDHLIQVDDGVIEQFRRGVSGSHRIPLAWVAVGVESRKHDMVRVIIGAAGDPGAPFYSSPTFSEGAFWMDIPMAEEPRLRAFLSDAARSVGRTA